MTKADDQAIRDATEAAIVSVRSLLSGANSSINPRAMVGSLSDTELGYVVTSAVFAWIKAKAEAHLQYGALAIEQAIRTMGQSPEPQEAGAVAIILSKLADVSGLPWDKPVIDWTREEMIKLVWEAHRFVSAALIELDENMPNVVRRSLAEAEREFNAAHGGPLMTADEMEEAF